MPAVLAADGRLSRGLAIEVHEEGIAERTASWNSAHSKWPLRLTNASFVDRPWPHSVFGVERDMPIIRNSYW